MIEATAEHRQLRELRADYAEHYGFADEQVSDWEAPPGLDEPTALGLIVRGFVEPVARELPVAYAAEMTALLNLRMLGSVG